MKQKIKFKHWKTGEVLTIVCKPLPYNNPNSDRLVVYDIENNRFEDIIKSTIVKIENAA